MCRGWVIFMQLWIFRVRFVKQKLEGDHSYVFMYVCVLVNCELCRILQTEIFCRFVFENITQPIIVLQNFTTLFRGITVPLLIFSSFF